MSRIPGTKRRHTPSEAHSRKSFLSQWRGNCVDASMLIYTTCSVSSPFVVDRLRSTVNEKNMYIKRCFNKPEYYACSLGSRCSRTTKGRRALGGHELRGRVAEGVASILWDTCKTVVCLFWPSPLWLHFQIPINGILFSWSRSTFPSLSSFTAGRHTNNIVLKLLAWVLVNLEF